MCFALVSAYGFGISDGRRIERSMDWVLSLPVVLVDAAVVGEAVVGG